MTIEQSNYVYDTSAGELDSVVTRRGNGASQFEMKERNKYHSGLLKERKVRFTGSAAGDMDNALFRYGYEVCNAILRPL